MSPVTHFLVGWAVANAGGLGRKERAVVALAGIAPDFDGFGLAVDFVTRRMGHSTNWWGLFHHFLGHNIGFGLLVMLTAGLVAAKRWQTVLLAGLSFHLHLLGDIVGARGPDGDQWPIPYLLPFSRAWNLSWSGQWALNAWPNFVITGGLLAATFYLACRRGYSPLEMASLRADRVFVETVRKRFGIPAAP